MKRILLALALCLTLTGCEQHRTPAAGDLFNQPAQLATTLPYPVLSWHPLTSRVDRQQHTTSTLFGNDAAQHAAQNAAQMQAQSAYPPGTVLALVTWHERDDPHWFGARIPDQPALVEVVEFRGAQPAYRRFSGPGLPEQAVPSAEQQSAGAAITSMKPVRLP